MLYCLINGWNPNCVNCFIYCEYFLYGESKIKVLVADFWV